MLQNACHRGTTAFSGFYCKVCCSRKSIGCRPSRLTSRFNSTLGKRTASRQMPSSSCSSFCTAPSSKNCARSRAKRCGKRKVPTNKSPPSNSAMACSSNSRPLPSRADSQTRWGLPFSSRWIWLNAFKQIEFVIDLEDRQVLGSDLTQHHHHLLDLQHAIRFGRIDHVQQQV